MQCLSTLRVSALKLSCAALCQPHLNAIKRYGTPCNDCRTPKKKDPCEPYMPYKKPCVFPQDRKPCFDIRNVSIERATQCHSKLIRSFFYTQYWPREPSVISLWMPITSPYLEILTDKYSHSGERLLAFERVERTSERKLIGLTVANRVYPWMIGELEEWAHCTSSRPERHRMFFNAHCLKSPNLFAKFNVDYIYDIEVLGTSQEISGQGVGTLLLQSALASAHEMRHPLVQVVSVSQYISKICEKCGMKRIWTMDFADFVDDNGQHVFYPRRPHHTVGIYVKYFDPRKGGEEPCKPHF